MLFLQNQSGASDFDDPRCASVIGMMAHDPMSSLVFSEAASQASEPLGHFTTFIYLYWGPVIAKLLRWRPPRMKYINMGRFGNMWKIYLKWSLAAKFLVSFGKFAWGQTFQPLCQIPWPNLHDLVSQARQGSLTLTPWKSRCSWMFELYPHHNPLRIHLKNTWINLGIIRNLYPLKIPGLNRLPWRFRHVARGWLVLEILYGTSASRKGLFPSENGDLPT